MLVTFVPSSHKFKFQGKQRMWKDMPDFGIALAAHCKG